MSRSGYNEDGDCEQWQYALWRGQLNSAIKGRRGQGFLKEMLVAMDAMPVKRLIAHELEAPDLITCSHWGLHETTSVCAIGTVGKARGIDMIGLDPEDSDTVSGTFNIARPLACEVVYLNDEARWNETPEARFARMRAWVQSQIREPAAVGT